MTCFVYRRLLSVWAEEVDESIVLLMVLYQKGNIHANWVTLRFMPTNGNTGGFTLLITHMWEDLLWLEGFLVFEPRVAQ